MSLSKYKIRLFWLLLLILILSFLGWQVLSPTGAWTCSQDFSDDKWYFNNLWLNDNACLSVAAPAERAVLGQDGSLLILAEPVYFSIFSPRAFSRAEVEITYRPYFSSSTPIFEAGFLADSKLWRYQLQPVYNLWLERGLTDWSQLSDGNLHLFQRQARFAAVADFLQAWRQDSGQLCTEAVCLATYNLSSLELPPLLSQSIMNLELAGSSFPYDLRGPHQFYFYLPAKGLKLSGVLSDRNENKDNDRADFFIFSGKNLVASSSIADNRLQSEMSGELSDGQNFDIIQPDLPAGLYRLDFRGGDDLILSGLRINSSYLSVINKIWIWGGEEIKLVTDAPYLQIKALNPEALQAVTLEQKKVIIDEIYRQYEVKTNNSKIINLSLSRGGLILENNGVFAISSSTLLNPDYPRLDRFAPALNQLDFVLADYKFAQKQTDDWFKSDLQFNIGGFYRENNHYSFILSVPGLKLDSRVRQSGEADSVSGLLEIKKIKVRFYGKSLWEKIKEHF